MSNLSRTVRQAVRVALIGGVTLAASLGLAAPQFNGPVNPNANDRASSWIARAFQTNNPMWPGICRRGS